MIQVCDLFGSGVSPSSSDKARHSYLVSKARTPVLGTAKQEFNWSEPPHTEAF